MRYEATRSNTNKRKWTIRLITDNGPNMVYGYTTFTSQKRAIDWAERLNESIGADYKHCPAHSFTS